MIIFYFEKERQKVVKKIRVNIYFDHILYICMRTIIKFIKLKGIFERKHHNLGSELLIYSKSYIFSLIFINIF